MNYMQFLQRDVKVAEGITQELLNSWEAFYNAHEGTVTYVQNTGDSLVYFRDPALGGNWVIGWVITADSRLYQFGPVAKPFYLREDADEFHERFGNADTEYPGEKPSEPSDDHEVIIEDNPETPDNPEVPDTPEEPSEPTESEEPIVDNPDNPETPDEPAEETPDNPGEPDNPETPDEPKVQKEVIILVETEDVLNSDFYQYGEYGDLRRVSDIFANEEGELSAYFENDDVKATLIVRPHTTPEVPSEPEAPVDEVPGSNADNPKGVINLEVESFDGWADIVEVDGVRYTVVKTTEDLNAVVVNDNDEYFIVRVVIKSKDVAPEEPAEPEVPEVPHEVDDIEPRTITVKGTEITKVNGVDLRDTNAYEKALIIESSLKDKVFQTVIEEKIYSFQVVKAFVEENEEGSTLKMNVIGYFINTESKDLAEVITPVNGSEEDIVTINNIVINQVSKYLEIQGE